MLAAAQQECGLMVARVEASRLAGSCCVDSIQNDSGINQNDGIEDRRRLLPTFHAAARRVVYQKPPAATAS